ncbi:Bifunctional transcriptional activator/DNA repair enzyme Ada [Achromobacter ruhlandii]|nr:Bifunctional transcriptional activator/DNA repair enzyme Ada [Achromobacter ruhlandii]
MPLPATTGVRRGQAFENMVESAQTGAPLEPDMTHAAPLSKQHAAAVERACRALEAEQPPDLNTLAEQAGMSRFHFHRIFKAATGITPKAYANALRADRARQQLRQGASVTDAMYGAGFNSSGRFYEAAPAILGMTPTAFRKDGEGVEIRFAVGQCALGALLVAASDTGICEIALHEDPEQLVRNLQDRFKAARLIGADREFEQWMAAVVGFVENPSVGLHLPLDVRGTAFQRRVWEALREIPVGATVTYTDIAERIGSPRSVRAVARACATNNIALAIPCHRVVRTDGSLAGYRWGIERKRELIEREAKAA